MLDRGVHIWAAICYNVGMETPVDSAEPKARVCSAAGQAMVEYILVFAVLTAVAVALTGFFAAERRSAARTTGLVASEYP